MSLNLIKKALLGPIISGSYTKLNNLKENAYKKVFGLICLFLGGLLLFATIIIALLEFTSPKIQLLTGLSAFETTLSFLLVSALSCFLIGYIGFKSEHIKKFFKPKQVKPTKRNLLAIAASPFLEEMNKENKEFRKKISS